MFLLSPNFPYAFQACISALTVHSSQIVLAALDAVRAIIGHEALQLDTNNLPPNPPSYVAAYPAYALAIRTVVEQSSAQLIGLLIETLVEGDEDASTNVLTIIRLLSIQFGPVLAQTVPGVIETMSNKILSDSDKVEFASKFNA